ncbi:MAG: ribosomal-protein-alanine N-acetyltransferase [Gammaproteobacteria bacterium]
MSAVRKPGEPNARPMREEDLRRVLNIERAAYGFPWSEGIFRDCLQVGYCCWVVERDDDVAAYGIMQVAVSEAHVLNLCVDPLAHGQGVGRAMLRCLLQVARDHGGDSAYLEARPTNEHALALYRSEGFRTVGTRRAYYPSEQGREDALILSLDLRG